MNILDCKSGTHSTRVISVAKWTEPGPNGATEVQFVVYWCSDCGCVWTRQYLDEPPVGFTVDPDSCFTPESAKILLKMRIEHDKRKAGAAKAGLTEQPTPKRASKSKSSGSKPTRPRKKSP